MIQDIFALLTTHISSGQMQHGVIEKQYQLDQLELQKK